MREPIGAAEDKLAHPGVPQLRASYRRGITAVDSQRSPSAIEAGWHTATSCAGSTGARARRSSPRRGTHDPTCTCSCRKRGRRDSRHPQGLQAGSAPGLACGTVNAKKGEPLPVGLYRGRTKAPLLQRLVESQHSASVAPATPPYPAAHPPPLRVSFHSADLMSPSSRCNSRSGCAGKRSVQGPSPPCRKRQKHFTGSTE